MLYEILPDPRPLIADDRTRGRQVLQFHRVIPDPVPVGHFDSSGREIVDALVDRAEYLAWIEQACAARGCELEVRFYDHFEEVFDAEVLDHLPSVANLAIDSLHRAVNLDAIGRLPNLRTLRFGPVRAENAGVLRTVGIERLTTFTLAGTPSPAVDLAPLADARALRTLRLLGHGKNTEAIGALTGLTELAIQPSIKAPIDFIAGLTGLEVLKFVLGSCPSLEPLGDLPALRDLSLREVRNCEDLGDLQRFPALRRLQVSDQPKVAAIRLGPANARLEHLYLYSMPRLERIEGLESLSALVSLFAYDTRLEPRWDALPASLSHFRLMTKTMKGRDAHEAEVRAKRLIPEVHPDATWFYK